MSDNRAGPMRIAIDARKLHDFGIGTYIRNLVHELAEIDPGTEYVLFARPGDLAEIAATGRNVRGIAETARPYSFGELVRLPLASRRAHADLFHAPHYVLPPFVTGPTVVTIHDCIHLRFPQYLPSRTAWVYAHTMIRLAARKATRILTVSDASKRDILHYTGVRPEKVVVVHNGLDARFATPPDAEALERVRQRFDLVHPFVLYVGNIKPHKNLERLIEGFALARAGGPDDLRLVLIGDEISKYPTLRQSVHRHRLDKYVRYFGFQPAATLVAFYRLARAFVFPSLYEGFGLPPLEAMANLTPVVTSNLSSMPEVVGDAAVLVDPYDVQSIADGIHRAVSDEPLRQVLIERGRLRAQTFSWRHAAEQTLAVYHEALGRA
jgi:glycosyltransferase involved in cell wall biosynthesis